MDQCCSDDVTVVVIITFTLLYSAYLLDEGQVNLKFGSCGRFFFFHTNNGTAFITLSCLAFRFCHFFQSQIFKLLLWWVSPTMNLWALACSAMISRYLPAGISMIRCVIVVAKRPESGYWLFPHFLNFYVSRLDLADGSQQIGNFAEASSQRTKPACLTWYQLFAREWVRENFNIITQFYENLYYIL